MELHHTLCSLQTQKMWTGEIHRESQQSYCQGDFSCVFNFPHWTEKFKPLSLSNTLSRTMRLKYSVAPYKYLGWSHVGYYAGMLFYSNSYVHIGSAFLIWVHHHGDVKPSIKVMVQLLQNIDICVICFFLLFPRLIHCLCSNDCVCFFVVCLEIGSIITLNPGEFSTDTSSWPVITNLWGRPPSTSTSSFKHRG